MTPAAELHAPAQSLDFTRFMSCLAQVESSSPPSRLNYNAAGRKGELGPWQMTRLAWELTTTQWPFTYATDPIIGYAVAMKRAMIVCDEIKRKGGQVDAFVLALAWRCGVSGLSSVASESVIDSARRVANLYNEAN